MSLHNIFRAWLLLLWYKIATGRLLFDDFETYEEKSHYGRLLNNQHIVFIGDSLMRYQYLDVVYLIHKNAMILPEQEPKIVEEKSHHSWLEFHQFTNKLFAPNEYCDCFRLDNIIAQKCYENRYYHNAARNISISFFLYLGDENPTRGQYLPGDAEGNDHFKAPDVELVPPKWEYASIADVISNIAAKLLPKPSTLVLNAGHWPHYYMNETHRTRVIHTAHEHFSRVIWKTTSGHNALWKGDPVDPIMCAMENVECLDLSWTLYLQMNSYIDYHHFKTPVYNDITMQLAKQISTGHSVRHAPLQKHLHYSVLEVSHKDSTLHYMVDPLGLLRKFTMPSLPTRPTTIYAESNVQTQAQQQLPCIQELIKRPVVRFGTAEIKTCIAGEDISNICTYLKQEIHEGDLMRIDNSKSVFLIENGKRREFNSFQAFVSRGYDFDNVKVVNIYDGEAFPSGSPLV